MDTDMQKLHGHERASWTWTNSIDMDMQNEPGHAAWTCTCTCTWTVTRACRLDIHTERWDTDMQDDIDMYMQYRYVYIVEHGNGQ